VRAAVLESAYLAADIEQSQLLPGYLDAGDFPFRKSSSAITACHVSSYLFLPPLVRVEFGHFKLLKRLQI
jgi:hypothetical protein